MSNETTKVVTKVIDVRHKAPDQAIHELMQAAKDGFAVTKIATRFNHTHVYLEANSSQISETKIIPTTETVKEETPKEETPVKTVAKKTATKSVASTKATATPKKEEPKAPEQESSD